MVNDQPSYNIKVDHQRAWEFLQALGTEDYRGRLEANTVEALADFGIEVPPEIIPGGITLPPPELIDAQLQTISEDDVVGQVRFIFHLICFFFPWLR